MFRESQALSSFSTNDTARAREFYGGTLGLDVTEANGILTIALAGGGKILVYPKEDHAPATFTVLSFMVGDIDVAAAGLAEAGIELERYEGFPQDERGIMRPPSPADGPPIAWFTDPAGNILAVIQA